MNGRGLEWLDANGPHAAVVLSTRVRLARNLQGCAFVSQAGQNARLAVMSRVEDAVGRMSLLEGAAMLRMTAIPERRRRILHERRLVSQELLGSGGEPPLGTAVIVPAGPAASLMINEEDHLRLQGLVPGLQLMEAWRRVDGLDEEIGGVLPLAYHNEFGYLTACPTNVGTGLRASALVHMPGLVLTKEIEKALRGVSQVGLTFRGLYGEGSGVVGNFFQISNQTTLGKKEEDLVDHVARIVDTVIQKEFQAREVLMRDAGAATEDKVWRAYGLLRHARNLRYEELMNLLSGVRLGVALELLPGPPVRALNEIMIRAQTAHLEEEAGRALSPPQRHARRAGYVRASLEAAASGSGGTSGSQP